MLMAIGTFALVFKVPGAMDGKKYNQSQRKKNKMHPVTIYLAAIQLSVLYFALKMDNFA